ncbi:MAG: hypothetical protein ACTSP4_09405 [Candidatus Hodarchaeales archaeon]
MSDAKFDEITRSSLMICLFSHVDKATMVLDNKPYLLGGSGFLVKDKDARLQVETAYAQLSIPDLFGQFDFILNVANFTPYKLKEDLRIAPNIYTLKTKYKNMYLMLLILTPWSDLNLTALYEDVKELIMDYSGSYRRINIEISDDNPYEENEAKNAELSQSASLLLQRIYYKIFLERVLIGGVEKTKTSTNLIAVLFQQGTIHSRHYCEQCKLHVYGAHDDYGDGKTCDDCGNLLTALPPVFTTEEISIAFPDDLTELEKNSSKIHMPVDLMWLFQSSQLPDEISRALFKMESDIFQRVLAVPNKAYFDYRNSDDAITLYTLWRQRAGEHGGKIMLVTGVGDSTISGKDTLSSMAMRIFIRDLNDGIRKKLNRREIIKKSILRDWNVSKWIPMSGEATPEALTCWKALNDSLEDI